MTTHVPAPRGGASRRQVFAKLAIYFEKSEKAGWKNTISCVVSGGGGGRGDAQLKGGEYEVVGGHGGSLELGDCLSFSVEDKGCRRCKVTTGNGCSGGGTAHPVN